MGFRWGFSTWPFCHSHTLGCIPAVARHLRHPRLYFLAELVTTDLKDEGRAWIEFCCRTRLRLYSRSHQAGLCLVLSVTPEDSSLRRGNGCEAELRPEKPERDRRPPGLTRFTDSEGQHDGTGPARTAAPASHPTSPTPRPARPRPAPGSGSASRPPQLRTGRRR